MGANGAEPRRDGPAAAAGLAAARVPLGVVTALGLVDLAWGRSGVLIGFLLVGPLLAAVFVGPLGTALVGLYATAAGLGLGAPNGIWGSLDHLLRVLAVAVASGLAVWAARHRVSREHQLLRLHRVAETAQQAILRPVPATVGPVRLATRYVSATPDANIGGDLVEVADTPQGVRLVVGDVRGKGLAGVRLAAVTLGSFREAAFGEPTLEGVARVMNGAVQRYGGPEDFVTALLVEVSADGSARQLNCGHCPPLLVRRGQVTVLDDPDAEPPLGLDPRARARPLGVGAGDRLLLHTDGLVEARDGAGSFFALADVAPECLSLLSPDDALDALLARLRAHVGEDLADDIALVLVEVLGRSLQPSDAECGGGALKDGTDDGRYL